MKEELVMSLPDLFFLFKRSKKLIRIVVFIFAVLGLLFGLFRPVAYIGKATFRDKAASESNVQDFSASLKILGLSDGGTTEAVSWMKSRFLIGKLAKQLSLQGQVDKIENGFPLLARLRDNVKVDIALWMKQKSPSLPDLEREMEVTGVVYDEEYPTHLKIYPIDKESFQVVEKKTVLGEGRFGEPFSVDHFSFTLHSKTLHPHRLTLWPLWKTTDDLIANLQIKPDTKDKTLFNLTFADRDRHLASACLNRLMELYLDQLRHEHRFLLQEHLEYLQKRQDEMNESLKSVLETHVSTLSSDLSTSGFPSSQSEVEYLSENMVQLTKNLHQIEMEKKRLMCFREGGFTYSEDHPGTITATLAEIRQLKKQGDVLSLALINNRQDLQKEKFTKLIEEHQTVLQYAQEVKEMLQSKQPNVKKYALFQDPKYIADLVWDDPLFFAYLQNLDHFFEVYDKTLKERIAHQQNPPDELQGMNLETAQEAYGNFCKMRAELESHRRQLEYVVQQMENPDFEISSLSAVLEDPVSFKLIEKATQLELVLKEEGNRSLKELERLKSELSHSRGFLRTHVHQSLELIKVREKLMHEKTYHLQQTALELIRQQISILEKSLKDFIETRLLNLEQEKEFIYQQQEKMQLQMAKIPAKWVSEKMIDSQMKLNQQLMSELTRLVENKNISTNLEAVRSTPIDTSIPSVHPRSPRILLLTLFGAFFGLFCSCFYLFSRAIIYGFPVSAENLRLLKQHVSSDMRSLMTYFEMTKPSDTCRDLLVVGAPVEELAALMEKMDQRVFVLKLESEQIGSRRFQQYYQELKSRHDWVIAYTDAPVASSEAASISAHFERIAYAYDGEIIENLYPLMVENKKITFVSPAAVPKIREAKPAGDAENDRLTSETGRRVYT